jgi:DNA-binding transcriptional MerR regulator
LAGRNALTREEIASLKTIGEVAGSLDLPQHVLRFWETRFKEIAPVKRAGGRRFYRPRDIELVEAIRHLLYREGYTIKGVQRILEERGVDAVVADVARRQCAPPEPEGAPVDRLNQRFSGQATLDLPAPAPAWDRAPEPLGAEPVALAQTPVFHAPMVIVQPGETDAEIVLRRTLAEIEECRRLLALTRR